MTHRPIADLRRMKGKRQLTMLRVETLEEAEAAERAGIDMLSVHAGDDDRPAFATPRRPALPFPGCDWRARPRPTIILRAAFQHAAGRRRRGLLRGKPAHHPAPARRGHPGLRPCRPDPVAGDLDRRLPRRRQDRRQRRWSGGRSRRWRKPAPSPPRSRWCRPRSPRAISERTSLFMISMGAGAGCDAQYLFADDVLGANRGHFRATPRSTATSPPNTTGCRASASPRSANSSAMSASGAYPASAHTVAVEDSELAEFRRRLTAEAGH